MFLVTACGQQKPIPVGFAATESIPSTQSPNLRPKVRSASTTTTPPPSTTAPINPPMVEPSPFVSTTTTTIVPEAPRTTESEIHLLPGMQASDFEKRGNAIPTVYYNARYELAKQTCEGSKKLQILDPNDQVLVELCPRAHADCLLQGSCLIVDEDGLSISINYVRNVNKIPRFVEVESERCPFGLGVQNLCLDPFFTVAADLNFFNPGEVLYIPALVGVVLPNGRRHQGYFVVRDRGGGIKGEHRFDFFSGFFHFADPRNPFTKVGLQDQTNHFPYYRVKGASAEAFLKKRDYPELPRSNKSK